MKNIPLKTKTFRMLCLFFFALAGCSAQGATAPAPTLANTPPIATTPATAAEKPDAQPALAVLKQNGVTVSLNWVYADSDRIAVEYEVSGVSIPEGYMLPCPVQSMSLSDQSGSAYDSYQYAYGNSEALVTHCQPEADQASFLVTHDFYVRQPDGNKPLDLGLDVFIGGMDIHSENGDAVTIPDAGRFHFDFTVPTDGKLTLNPVQTLSRDGLSVTLNRVEVNPSFVNAFMCIEYAIKKGWYPDAAVSIDGKKIHADPVLTFRTDFKNSDPPNWFDQFTTSRCFRFPFLINAGMRKVNTPMEMTVSLESMKINIMDAATQDDCAAIRAKTQKTYPDLDFVCEIGGGRPGEYGILIKITKTPAGMSTDDAQKIAQDGFVSVINGPWDFHLQLP
ncbi:MAG: hypothetical protein WA821_14140 [Anaerolineales bacterium]